MCADELRTFRYTLTSHLSMLNPTKRIHRVRRAWWYAFIV